MEEAFQAILDSLPPKPARSKLEPYAELIRELRKRGRSYREIASILAERCGVTVGIHTVYNFVQVRSKAKGKASTAQRQTGTSSVAESSSPVLPNGVEARIQALKQRATAARGAGAEKVFHYDENEPLRLPSSSSEQKKE